jgi:hypothetical protein
LLSFTRQLAGSSSSVHQQLEAELLHADGLTADSDVSSMLLHKCG